MKKYILWIVILAMAVAVGILAMVNRNQTLETAQAIGDTEVLVKLNGEKAGSFDLAFVQGMTKITFDDKIKENGKNAVAVAFGGVLLRDVLDEIGVDISGFSDVTYKARDGYASAGTVDEILNSDTVYIAYERNGEQIKAKEQGGTGPMEVVIANQTFSLRNCKYLLEIDFTK